MLNDRRINSSELCIRSHPLHPTIGLLQPLFSCPTIAVVRWRTVAKFVKISLTHRNTSQNAQMCTALWRSITAVMTITSINEKFNLRSFVPSSGGHEARLIYKGILIEYGELTSCNPWRESLLSVKKVWIQKTGIRICKLILTTFISIF